MNKTPTTLIIMDGFGIAPPADDNAVTLAKTPVLDKLFQEYAHTTLSASGLDVGLPAGQMGNSEVGHTNIGGGRVVFQDLPRISRAIEDGSFFKNEAYNKAMDDCLKNDSSLHLYGLLSDGGVHSHIDHLFALLELAKRQEVPQVYVHAFLDGRDVSPTSGLGFVQQHLAAERLAERFRHGGLAAAGHADEDDVLRLPPQLVLRLPYFARLYGRSAQKQGGRGRRLRRPC